MTTLSPSAPGIGHKTASSFFWLIGQGVGEKVVTLVGQVALARLLTKEDFKLVALTYTITTFAALLQQAGLSQVLIQRHGRFHLWATTVFWMSLAIGLTAGIATAAISPVVASFYHEPALRGLLLAAAITLPLNGLMTVPDAKMRAEMRFKFIAAVGLLAIVCTTGLSVALAAMKFGAYSFIIPPAVVALLRAAIMWWRARPKIGLNPHFRRWKYLITDGSLLLLGSLALMITYQGGQAILGRLYPTLAAAGVYYFAWNLSDQSLRLLVNNLAGVLFPALSTMQDDPARQQAAYLKTTRMLLFIGLPICLIQAVLAGPLIRLVFSTHWLDAIPVMAALCIGMTARLVHGPSESMFLAQRRAATYMKLSVGYAVFFLLVVGGVAYGVGPEHAATGAAIGAGACLAILGPFSLRLAIAPSGGGWRQVLGVYALPVAAAAVAFVPSAFVVSFFSHTVPGDILAIVVASAISLSIYAEFMWVFARKDFNDLRNRVLAVARRGPKFRPGHCRSCGYDMTGLGGPCPECGSTTS